MDDDVEPEFNRKIELLFKQTGLLRLIGAIVNACLDSFFCRILKCVGNRFRSSRTAFLGQFQTREPMVIQSRFTKRDDARTSRQLT